MDISAVASTGGVAANVNTRRGLSDVTGEDFMNILVKQLQMQDPFEPMTNEEMVNQISTIRELEMNTRLNEKLENLTDEQRYGAVASLIGKYVQGAVSDEEGNEFPVEGVVKGVRFTSGGKAILELDSGEKLPVESLQAVTEVEDAGVLPGGSGDDKDEEDAA